jgi:HEPN domain-containing protein
MMPERSGDWIRQAARDLESARSQKEAGFHEWACFIAQQAAEKALKALYQYLGAEAWGHSLLELLRGLEEKVPLPPGLREQALLLDRLYVPTRYPNGWAEGIPADYITEGDATDAISSAQEIVRFSEGRLARP